MTSDDFERFLETTAPDYNRPPDPPREEMWAVIQERRRGPERRAPVDLAERRDRHARRRRLRRWSPWGIGIAVAATLAVGFGLGRISGNAGPAGPPAVATAEAGWDDRPSRTVQFAAAGHLGEAEAMLTFYRGAEDAVDRQATARWARELLTTTRFMLDSRAGEDQAMAVLLEDLELVLVQIVAAGDDPSEQRIIEDGIEQNEILAKLRTASGGTLDMAL